jgi:hypothetical protein
LPDVLFDMGVLVGMDAFGGGVSFVLTVNRRLRAEQECW